MMTIPPTPPRSPTIPEPYVDDLLELWSESRQTGSGKINDISFHSALSHLDMDYSSDSNQQQSMYSFESTTTENDDDEDLLKHLISLSGLQYTFEDSPPPTNPPSPPDHSEGSDPETMSNTAINFHMDHHHNHPINSRDSLHHHLTIKIDPDDECYEDSEEETKCGDFLFNTTPTITSTTSTNNNNQYSDDDNELNQQHKTNTNNNNNHSSSSSSTTSSSNDTDSDVEFEEFNRYPKTEPITEEFTSHIYDNFFNMFTYDDDNIEEEDEDDNEEEIDPINNNNNNNLDHSSSTNNLHHNNNNNKSNHHHNHHHHHHHDSNSLEDHEPLKIKLENDITEIKHDCMWAGSCESDTHQDSLYEIFGSSSYNPFDFNKAFGEDEDSLHNIRLLTPDLEDDEEEEEEEEEDEVSSRCSMEQDNDVEEEEEYDEDLINKAPMNSIALSDHSYAFNAIGPLPQHSPLSLSSQTALQFSAQQQQQQSSTSSLFSQSTSSDAIPGFIIKEEISEESATRKTKILVPLKQLMETLQQKPFLVAPLGPGKKVIRLTGNGETVKGILDIKGAQFKSATSFTTTSSSTSATLSGSSGKLMKNISCSSSSNNNSNNNNKPPSKKMKKAIHKPKQELSPSSPIHHNSLTTISSASSSSLSCSSNSSSSSSNNNSTNNNGKPKKAKTHNNMERMRRIDLRNSFDTLKKLVPPLNKAAKCSKVEILKRASEYINNLKSVEKRLLREEHNLKVKNENLRNRAAFLTNNN